MQSNGCSLVQIGEPYLYIAGPVPTVELQHMADMGQDWSDQLHDGTHFISRQSAAQSSCETVHAMRCSEDQASWRWEGMRTLKHGLQLRLCADGGPGEWRAGGADGDGRNSAILAGGSALVWKKLAVCIPAASNPAGIWKSAFLHALKHTYVSAHALIRLTSVHE